MLIVNFVWYDYIAFLLSVIISFLKMHLNKIDTTAAIILIDFGSKRSKVFEIAFIYFFDVLNRQLISKKWHLKQSEGKNNYWKSHSKQFCCEKPITALNQIMKCIFYN